MMKSLLERDHLQASISMLLVMFFLIFSIVCGWFAWTLDQQEQEKFQEANQLTYLALETKYWAADLNGWQTAYAFDILRGVPDATDDTSYSRSQFLHSADMLYSELKAIREHLSTQAESDIWDTAHSHFQNFMAVDQEVIEAYRSGNQPRIEHANELVLGREIDHFSQIVTSTEQLTVLILELSNQILEEAKQDLNWVYRLMLLCGGCSLLLLQFFTARANRFVKIQFKLLRKADRIARTDGLTGVANRRTWDEELKKALEYATFTQEPLTLALLDLDHFKRFNDTRGHQAGDVLLRATAQAWAQQLRSGDLLARYGGEEFGILLPKCNPENAANILERLREQVPDQQTFSAGIAAWDGQEDPLALVARADQALYAAKENGRNRSEIAQPPKPSASGTSPSDQETKTLAPEIQEQDTSTQAASTQAASTLTERSPDPVQTA